MRAECFDENDNYHTEESKIERRTLNAHLYYNSPQCVIDTISAGFIKTNLILGLITLAVVLLH